MKRIIFPGLPRYRARDRGVALLVTIGVIFLVLLAVLTTSSNASQNLSQISLQVYEKQAVRVAEGGLHKAIVALRDDDAWSGFTPAAQTMPGFPDFSYTVDVTRGPATNAADGTVIPSGAIYLRSTAWVTRGVSRTVSALAVMGSTSVFRAAVWGRSSVEISGNAIIDSYDSRLGSYTEPTSPRYGATVGTNASGSEALTMDGSSYVDGNLYVPTGADPDVVVSGEDHATGTVNVLDFTVPMDPVTVPATGGPNTNISYNGGRRNLAPGGYGSLTARGNAQIILSEGTYVFGNPGSGNVKLEGGASFVLPAGTGPVKIYFTGKWDTGGGSLINQTGDPANLLVFGSSSATEATLSGNAQAYLGFYAPNATVTVIGNDTLYGSVIGDRVDITGSAAIHHDDNLSRIEELKFETNWILTALHRW